MDDLRRLFPPPRLSPYFAARVTANLPREEARPTPRWVRFYWLAVALIALGTVAAANPPEWILYPLVPLGFAVMLVPRRTFLRALAPFLR